MVIEEVVQLDKMQQLLMHVCHPGAICRPSCTLNSISCCTARKFAHCVSGSVRDENDFSHFGWPGPRDYAAQRRLRNPGPVRKCALR